MERFTDYTAMESMKTAAHTILNSDIAPEKKYEAMRVIAYAHWLRSYDSAPDGHPYFEKYFQHYVWSEDDGFPLQCIQYWREHYKKPEVLRIKPGSSYWGTF